jgi:hypothetical protein
VRDERPSVTLSSIGLAVHSNLRSGALIYAALALFEVGLAHPEQPGRLAVSLVTTRLTARYRDTLWRSCNEMRRCETTGTRLPIAVRLLAADPDVKPHHFCDVMLIGKLLSHNVYFQKRKTIKIGENNPQTDLSSIESNIVLQYQYVIWSIFIYNHQKVTATGRTIWPTHGLSLRSNF